MAPHRLQVFLIGCAALFFASGSYAREEHKPLPPRPFYFVQDSKGQNHSFGLRAAEDGRLTLEDGSGRSLEMVPDPKRLFGAAFYQDENSLVAIETDGTVLWYGEESGIFQLKNKRSVEYPASVLNVFFTRVPGLVYLLLEDTQEADRLRNSPEQSYADRYGRITLQTSAEGWHAIPAEELTPSFLTGCYTMAGKKVTVSLREDERIELSLPEPLDEPFRSGPYDPLAEAIFVFPKEGIVCKTQKGWSLHRMDGSLVKWFSAEGIEAFWWEEPTVKEGSFFIHSRTGYGGGTFKLDADSGTLIRTED